jgi:hypothetical protein
MKCTRVIGKRRSSGQIPLRQYAALLASLEADRSALTAAANYRALTEIAAAHLRAPQSGLMREIAAFDRETAARTVRRAREARERRRMAVGCPLTELLACGRGRVR